MSANASGKWPFSAGPGLYDTPVVQQMVQSWVSWFKQHRRVLTADIIHVRRPDG